MKRLTVLLLLLCATAAHAGNAVSSVSVRTHRSLASVAVMATVSGDDDTTATLRLFNWWETTGQDDSGMVMVRRVGTNIYHGRILHMTPGRTANFYVEANDGGIKVRSAQDTVSCSQVRPNVATGPVFYVDQGTGSDSDNGTTPALAKKTIGAALTLLKASADSGAYGGIIIGPGEYHERLDLTFGRDGKPRFISGDRTNRDSTIICGANEHGEAGRYDETNNLSWTQIGYASTYPATVGVYKTLFPRAGNGYGDSVSSVIIGWGEYLHRKTSVLALFADSTGSDPNSNLAVGGEVSGWHWIDDTLFVKRASRATPAGSVFHFGYRNNLIAVGGRNWSIRNLTVRYAGGPWNDSTAYGSKTAVEDPGSNGNGIIAGRYGGNASGLVVDSCLIYGHSGIGVYAAYSSASLRADSVTVANTVFDGLTIGSMDYRDAKGRNEEDANICKVTGSHSNIYRNTVRETHNGYQVSPSAGSADSTWAYNTEVYGNQAYTLSDDAFEMDGVWGVNLLVAYNTSDLSGSGISMAPIYEGPLFAVYNTHTRFLQAGLKIGASTEGPARFYHNTFASEEFNSRAYEGESGGTIKYAEFYNNIFKGRVGIALPSDTAGIGTVAFNYNHIDSLNSVLIRFNDGGGASDWGDWLNDYGQDANSVTGSPHFYDWRVRDVRLTYSSPSYRAGRKIPGVNSGGMTGNKYLVLPHIGSKSCAGCWREEAEK